MSKVHRALSTRQVGGGVSAPRRDDGRPYAADDWTAGTVHQELIGVTDDGRLVLWTTGQVRPIDRFPRSGAFIQGGHYVVDWNGHDVTVHCSPALSGQVVVQVMCSNATPAAFPAAYVEARLRGQVVKDPVAQAEILARLENINRLVTKQQDTPARQRGCLDDPPSSRTGRGRRIVKERSASEVTR